LNFDGSNDSLVTGSINFTSTDKMSFVSGIRKTTSTVSTLFEISTSPTTNNGTFRLTPWSDAKYYFFSRGTAFAEVGSGAITAPATNVLSGQANISAPSISLSVNQVTAATSSASQGTGNYGTYAFYVGNGSAGFFNGRIYSLIVRGAASTSDQITATENWVNTKTKAY
jgi:hypothetical protein